MKTNDDFRRFGLVMAVVMLGGFGPGCANEVSTAVSPCPCADGYVCCSSGVCAATEDACGGATSALFVEAKGTWTGYIENVIFPSGSNALQITLAVAADGTPSGQVVFGEGPPPPLPTEPGIAWPGGTDITNASLLEGYANQAQSLRWEQQHLRFSIGKYTPWIDWCALQGNGCSLSGYGIDGTDGCAWRTTPPTPVACDYALDCMVCTCLPTGCTPDAYAFDITLRGDVGDGSTNVGGWHNFDDPTVFHNLRLMRTAR